MSNPRNSFFYILLIVVLIPRLSAQGQNSGAQREDYLFAEKVYNSLWAGFSSNKTKPELIFNTVPGNKTIARYAFEPGKKPVIVLDAALIGLLKTNFRQQSSTALACILGHELAHHYHAHQQMSAFAQRGGNEQLETQADLTGFFYAYIAGYPSFSVAERLFGFLYDHYQLDADNTGYQSKQDRIRSVRAQVSEAKKMAYTYESGKLLLLLNRPGNAYDCFKLVAATIPAREVINNLGLACLLRVSQEKWIDRREMPFVLPFEPDVSERLLANARGISEQEKMQRKELLVEAEKAFTEVYQQGIYEAASINLAVCQLLMENPSAAIGTINRMQSPPYEAIMVRGIAYLRDGQKERAASDFNRIMKEQSALARINSRIYQTVLSKGWPAAAETSVSGPSQRNVSLLASEKLPDLDLASFQEVTQSPFPISLGDTPFGEVYRFSIPTISNAAVKRYGSWVVLKAIPSKKPNRLGIETGDTESQLTGGKGYGAPDLIFSTGPNAAYYLYRSSQIIFVLRSGKVQEWIIFNKLP